ncbi:UDP-glucose dehydrogenase family protein [Streptomyces sp. NPDC088785]|uniref:UDP-glucose dehydrogenase family protein n=1 Tax=Streptomyces sp. NPDC088785 TaxID=3365897 RepID=UPI00380C6079
MSRKRTTTDEGPPAVTFIGCGYLGATYAACYAELGHPVLGVDTDPSKIAKLSAGELPFHEPGLRDVLRRNLRAGRLQFTTDYRTAAHFADTHFICVGTPQSPDSDAADLSNVESAVQALAGHLRKRSLIIGKSTVAVGTAARLAGIVQDASPPDVDVEVAWSPEFLQEGRAVEDVLRPHRIVFGADSDWARSMLHQAHAPLMDLACREGRDLPVVTTDLSTAELTKVAANAFLATKVSFINAVAEVCEAADADITQLAQGISLDPRIGEHFLKAGLGFGGGCLPKDIRAFRSRAEQLGVGPALRFLQEVDAINIRQRTRVVELARELLNRDGAPAGTPDLAGTRIGVWGSTFKPDSDDVRDSPALDVSSRLLDAGAEVVIFDPRGTDNARRHEPRATYATTAEEAVEATNLLCVLTDWPQFQAIDPHTLAASPSNRRIIDGRNCLDPQRWADAGWLYRGMGRGSLARTLRQVSTPA